MNIDEAIKVAEAATPGPWEWWTSCSWRRLSTKYGGDGDVLCPVKSRADGHPDCSIKQEDMTHIAKFDPPTVLALLRFVKRWDELHLHHRTVDDCKAAAAALHKARAAVDEALR